MHYSKYTIWYCQLTLLLLESKINNSIETNIVHYPDKKLEVQLGQERPVKEIKWKSYAECKQDTQATLFGRGEVF